MNRRHLLRRLATGPALAGASVMGGHPLFAQPATPPAPRGLPPIRIKDIQVVLTAPNGIRLVLVKVLTSEPDLYGWGCATFTQRALVVQTAVEQYLKPFLIGRNVDEIVLVSDEEMHEAARWLWFEFGIAADLSGAASVAALKAKRLSLSPTAHVCAIICGAGTDAVA